MQYIRGYEVIDILYHGKKHILYIVKKEQTEKPVILKTTVDTLPTIKDIEDLKHEYEILKKLDIVGVPKVYDLIEIDYRIYLEKELINTDTLLDLIKKHELSLLEKLELFKSLGTVVAECHENGIVHQNISPTSILWKREQKQAYLVDFSSAFEYKNYSLAEVKPIMVDGSHSYMSPEQTGRTNQSLDFRSDYYSLGASMYEAFTEKPPFDTTDVGEMIYKHLAIKPIEPIKVNNDIPRMVNDIILKCLEKDPRKRYQSGIGFIKDIETAIERLKRNGYIPEFQLGLHEIYDRFIFSNNIYGRDKELELLKKWYLESKEKNNLTFVAGPSGIGKTAFVQMFGTWVKDQGGTVIYGKFDKYSRNIPFSAIAQAFSLLINKILTLDSKKVTIWKHRIKIALGAYGKVITDIIPDLELLIGVQANLPERDAQESKIRLQKTLFDFIRCFCDNKNPLFIFIDDLQWVDSSSIALLERIAITEMYKGLMILGSYRTNSIDKSHILNKAFEDMEKKRIAYKLIKLEGLSTNSIYEFLKDSMTQVTEETKQLSDLLYDKTKGNPLFLRTILKDLLEKETLFYDYSEQKWNWNKDDILSLQVADNVVDILKKQIENLSENSVGLLKLASCLGSTFESELLFLCSDKENRLNKISLDTLLKSGLIMHFRSEKVYRFSHDQIQQAAYQLWENKDREKTHLKIAKIMHEYQDGKYLRNNFFQIINHYSNGIELVSDEQDKSSLRLLFLEAGLKAKESIAFEEAADILEKSLILFNDNVWRGEYSTAIKIHFALFEASYLTFNYQRTDELAKIIEKRAASDDDLLQLYKLQSRRYHQQAKYNEAIASNIKGLILLGYHLPLTDEELSKAFKEEFNKIEIILQIKTPEMLFNQANNTKESYVITLELLMNLFADAYLIGREEIVAFTSVFMARLAMENGNNQYTSIAYVYYASILCNMNRDHRKAHEIGTVAIKLADKYGVETLQNYVYHVFSVLVNHWIKPLDSSLEIWKKAVKFELASGSPYSGYSYLKSAHVLFEMGRPLNEVYEQVKIAKKFLLLRGQEGTDLNLQVQVEQPVKCLLGMINKNTSLDDETFNTEEFLKGFGEYPFFKAVYSYSSFMLKYYFDEDIPINDLDENIEKVRLTQQAQTVYVDSYMFYTLHLMKKVELFDEHTDKQLRDKIITGIKTMGKWKDLNPSIFKHKYLLLKSVFISKQLNYIEAIDLFDQAIDDALENKFIQDAALTCEEAAKFWISINKNHLAKPYLEKSYVLFERWGSKSKLSQLKEKYNNLLDGVARKDNLEEQLFNDTTNDEISDKLDFLSIIKASQAISKHIDLRKLSRELISIVVENAGATKGILILEDSGKYKINNIFYKNRKKAFSGIEGLSYEMSSKLSHAVVNYAIRTKKDVVLDNASTEGQFISCPYIRKNQISSICCLPIMHQSQLKALIYLENDEISSAFKSDRVKIIHLLASQATISMDNSRIYKKLDNLNKNLEEKVELRTNELNEKNNLLNKINIELERLSITDQLTGIYNRRYIDEKLKDNIKLCKRYGKSMAILLLDIDNFKQINDTYGHTVGDDVLIKLSLKLKNVLRSTDTLGRWGGEEFLIIIPDDDDVRVIAEKLRNSVESIEHYKVGKVTISLGLTFFKENDTETSIVNRADEALYEAKLLGKNQVKIR